MTTLIATSVVRGSRQGESHGGVYLIDLDKQQVAQTVDWNAMDIDWQGRGWDRGLRGISFDGDRIYIAASDELFAFSPAFEQITSYRSPYLKHCHEICRYKRRLYLTSTGFDSILGFDLDSHRFSWGLKVLRDMGDLRAAPFEPERGGGPSPGNKLHLNSVTASPRALFLGGLNTGGLYAYTGKHITQAASLPAGTHNAQPHGNGVLFNDTDKDTVRFVPTRGPQRVFRVPRYEPDLLTHTDLDDSRTARQAFGRGLCTIDDTLIAAGSSPSTITLHDLDSMKTTLSINLTMDIRNAIHGLEVWPFDH